MKSVKQRTLYYKIWNKYVKTYDRSESKYELVKFLISQKYNGVEFLFKKTKYFYKKILLNDFIKWGAKKCSKFQQIKIALLKLMMDIKSVVFN